MTTLAICWSLNAARRTAHVFRCHETGVIFSLCGLVHVRAEDLRAAPAAAPRCRLCEKLAAPISNKTEGD